MVDVVRRSKLPRPLTLVSALSLLSASLASLGPMVLFAEAANRQRGGAQPVDGVMLLLICAGVGAILLLGCTGAAGYLLLRKIRAGNRC